MKQKNKKIKAEAGEKFFCKRCMAEIPKEKYDKALASHWIPLCEDCELIFKEKFKKFSEVWPKFQQSLAKNSRKK